MRSLALLAILAGCAVGQTIEFGNGVFRVANWKADASTKDWRGVLAVYAGADNSTPMWGTYSVEAGVLQFRPRFPLVPGVRYRAVFHPAGGASIEKWFDGPAKSSEAATRVEHVFPSAAVLPSNVLKLYIVFSAPMSRGEAWKRIHLLDENGRAIKAAFVEIDQELWDPEFRRLTVLFDPGRIKRDLVPNRQMGAPIVDGRRYVLAIDGEYPDARGVKLAEGFRKVFRGGAADRNPPDPAQWRIEAPQAGTRNALVVKFGKPLDYALLQRTVSVVGPSGPVAGTIALTHEETEFDFEPVKPWVRGAYKLAIDVSLEDLAGNRIGLAFDRNEGDRSRAPSGRVFRAFEIR